MNIQAIIEKKLRTSYVPNIGVTMLVGDDPATQASWLDATGLPGK